MPVDMLWLGFREPQWSVRVLATSAAAVVASIALAGAVPAWRASHTDPIGPIKENSAAIVGHAGRGLRWLVAAELALSMVLVLAASLMTKSATHISSYGFANNARALLRVDINFFRKLPFGPLAGADTMATARTHAVARLLSTIRSLPGVTSASLENDCAAEHDVLTTDRTIEGGPAGYLPHGCTNVGGDYFRTLGFPIVDGRDFTDADAETGGAVILDQITAQRLFPHDRAVGRMVKLGMLQSARPWLRVIGVVRRDQVGFTRYPEAGIDSAAQVYTAVADSSRLERISVIVRPSSDASAAGAAVSEAVRLGLPPRSTGHVFSWSDAYFSQVRSERYLALMFVVLAVASLALGAAGLFSVVSYTASRRSREFAVRIALGASPENVRGLVLKDALMMSLAGTAIGAPIGMRACFMIWNMMWDVYPVDAGALIAAEGLLIAAAMLAALAPALRAMRAEPVEVLRAT